MRSSYKIILIGLLFLAAIIYVQLSHKGAKKRRYELSKKGEFAIGVFEYRIFSKASTYGICFSFNIENKQFQNTDFHCFMDSDEAGLAFTDAKRAKEGYLFIVIYEKNNPQNSIIRLDCPIKDSTDFKQYVLEFMQR